MWRAIKRLFRKRPAKGRIWYDPRPSEQFLVVWRNGSWRRAPTPPPYEPAPPVLPPREHY